MPYKKFFILLCVFTLQMTQLLNPTAALSDSLDVSSGALDTINKQLADLSDALSKSVAATKPLQSQLDSMRTQIAGIKSQVAAVKTDAIVKKRQIDDGYNNLSQKEISMNQTIR